MMRSTGPVLYSPPDSTNQSPHPHTNSASGHHSGFAIPFLFTPPEDPRIETGIIGLIPSQDTPLAREEISKSPKSPIREYSWGLRGASIPIGSSFSSPKQSSWKAPGTPLFTESSWDFSLPSISPSTPSRWDPHIQSGPASPIPWPSQRSPNFASSYDRLSMPMGSEPESPKSSHMTHLLSPSASYEEFRKSLSSPLSSGSTTPKESIGSEPIASVGEDDSLGDMVLHHLHLPTDDDDSDVLQSTDSSPRVSPRFSPRGEPYDVFGGMEGMDPTAGGGGAEESPAEPCGQSVEHPLGEFPSSTLFVRNINSNVEDEELRTLFEVYGPIRSMYTQCKHRGFVMISYYDIRHAQLAMKHLQGRVVRRRKLDIHYSIPKSYTSPNSSPHAGNFGQANTGLRRQSFSATAGGGGMPKMCTSWPGPQHLSPPNAGFRPKPFYPPPHPMVSPPETSPGTVSPSAHAPISSSPKSPLKEGPASPQERMRRHHRQTAPEDKSKFEFHPDKVRRGDDQRTTLMIKNIPNKYNQKMLLSVIDEHFKGQYDFFYLPIDFKNKCNVGYAFINFINPMSIVNFFEEFNGRKWEKFNSEKVCTITYARIQGKAALIQHFQNSSLMSEDKKCRPIIFHSDGPNQGEQEPFPLGPNVRPRRTSSGKNIPKPSSARKDRTREEKEARPVAPVASV